MPTPSDSASDARPTGSTRLTWAVRIVAMVVSAGLGVLAVLLLYLVFGSVFDPSRDPHGYGVIFGVLFLLPVLLLLALVLPLCWPPGQRARAMLFTALGCLGILVLGFGVLMVA